MEVQSMISVDFRVFCETQWGEDVFLSGSVAPSLGEWRENNAIKMQWTPHHIWTCSVVLPPNTEIDYKYFKRKSTSTIWEACSNRCLYWTECPLNSSEITDKWQDDGGCSFDGTMTSGQREGVGIQRYRNGAVYCGEWKNNGKEGKGSFTDKEGTYVGTWKNNSKHGNGILLTVNGDTLEQSWNYGKLIGGAKEEQQQVSQDSQLSLKQNKQMNELHQAEIQHLLAVLHSAKEQIEQLEQQRECLICMNSPRNCVLLPCTHFLYCAQCVSMLPQNSSCPYCRTPIQGSLQLKTS
jgi:hypothetical protein